MYTEVEALAKMNSPFIIKYYGTVSRDDRLYIITEFADKGNIAHFLKSQKKGLDETLIWKIFLQCVMGLHHIHVKRILHRDIKTLNIFLDKDNNVKIGDMGISKIMGTNSQFAQTLVGTPYYLAPELCEGQQYNEKADMWALGIVLYECCTNGERPFEASNLAPLVFKIMNKQVPDVLGYSPELTQMVALLLKKNMHQRASSHDILTHPTVTKKAKELHIDLSVVGMDYDLAAYASMVGKMEKHSVQQQLGDMGCGDTRRSPMRDAVEPERKNEVANGYKEYVRGLEAANTAPPPPPRPPPPPTPAEPPAEQGFREPAGAGPGAAAGSGDLGSTVSSGVPPGRGWATTTISSRLNPNP
mmetsp:Transcript_38407/g.121365  ORF Transcript_38407/g.121365 Transcript_38407/m.121365 type:complete len:358 (+) Transcript_38407:509-1582(+)